MLFPQPESRQPIAPTKKLLVREGGLQHRKVAGEHNVGLRRQEPLRSTQWLDEVYAPQKQIRRAASEVNQEAAETGSQAYFGVTPPHRDSPEKQRELSVRRVT
jgi:hypothetical protein